MVKLPDTVPAPVPSIKAVSVAEDIRVRKLPASSVPLAASSMPLRFNVPANVTPAVLLMVRFLTRFPANVSEGMVWAVVPFIFMVPADPSKTPELPIRPVIWSVAPVTIRAALFCTVISFTMPVPESNTG
ncbi:hypothetical protein D3C85_1027170 [compost metagenome]